MPIDKRLDKIDERLCKIDKTLGEQHATLKEHVRRTDLLEHKVEAFTAFLNQTRGVGIVLGIIVGLCTVASLVLEIIKWIH